MIYEFVLGLGTIFVIILLWAILMYPFDTIKDTFYNITPSVSFNQTVNKTIVQQEYNLAGNVMYFSLFFIVIIIFVWIIKMAVHHQRSRLYGG